jgi:hypothetical protein
LIKHFPNFLEVTTLPTTSDIEQQKKSKVVKTIEKYKEFNKEKPFQ